MAVNGRCYAFLETALRTGSPGTTIGAKVSKRMVRIYIELKFALGCYVDVSCQSSAVTMRTICHKLKGELTDPVVRGFRHRNKTGDVLRIDVLLAEELMRSDKMLRMRRSINLPKLLHFLCRIFTEFQPVSDRSLLQGKSRRHSYYDLPRLVATTIRLGSDWGFSTNNLVAQYCGMPQPPRLFLASPTSSAVVSSSSSSASSSSSVSSLSSSSSLPCASPVTAASSSSLSVAPQPSSSKRQWAIKKVEPQCKLKPLPDAVVVHCRPPALILPPQRPDLQQGPVIEKVSCCAVVHEAKTTVHESSDGLQNDIFSMFLNPYFFSTLDA